jgi:hypothetical protein
MQFRLLGPVQVAEQNMAAALGGVEQRSLLAILLIVELEELRLAALEERIDADLADRRHGDLVSELEALIVAPLDAYRAARRGLADELGLDPGEELRRLERAIVLGAIRARPAATPPAPTVLVRRGAGQAGLAPDDPRTRFRWSLTGAGS